MSLPNSSDLRGMDYSFQAQPFISIPAKASITLTTMDYSFRATPFVANPYGTQIVGGKQHLYKITKIKNIKKLKFG